MCIQLHLYIHTHTQGKGIHSIHHYNTVAASSCTLLCPCELYYAVLLMLYFTMPMWTVLCCYTMPDLPSAGHLHSNY